MGIIISLTIHDCISDILQFLNNPLDSGNIKFGCDWNQKCDWMLGAQWGSQFSDDDISLEEVGFLSVLLIKNGLSELLQDGSDSLVDSGGLNCATLILNINLTLYAISSFALLVLISSSLPLRTSNCTPKFAMTSSKAEISLPNTTTKLLVS